MSALMHLQNKFQSYLINSDCDINADIEETKKVSAITRLQIYGDAYQSRLIEALASNYPILQKYLGDESFQELALHYIDEHPSTFRSIRWFGDQFENFLQKHNEPYLAELSKLEWRMTLTFDASDREIIDMTAVMQIPPDDWGMMQFTPHPSVYLLDFQWNVIQIWRSLSEDNSPDAPLKCDVPIPYIFWRKDLINQYCSLPLDEYFAIDSMMKGHTFGEICEGLYERVGDEDAALRAASLLKGWINSGLISAIEMEKFDEETG